MQKNFYNESKVAFTVVLSKILAKGRDTNHVTMMFKQRIGFKVNRNYMIIGLTIVPLWMHQ